MATQPTVSGVYTDWTNFKAIVSANSLIIQYTEDAKKYNIWTFNGPSLIRTAIFKAGIPVGGMDTTQNDADRSDFETNYKAGANGLERMAIRVESDTDINVNVQSEAIGTALRYESMTKNQSLTNGSYVTVYSYSGSGSLYSLFFELTDEDTDIQLTVDGVDVILDLCACDVPVAGPGNSGNGSLIPYISRASLTELVIKPPLAIKYNSSVVLKLKATASNKKLVGGFAVLTKVT